MSSYPSSSAAPPPVSQQAIDDQKAKVNHLKIDIPTSEPDRSYRNKEIAKAEEALYALKATQCNHAYFIIKQSKLEDLPSTNFTRFNQPTLLSTRNKWETDLLRRQNKPDVRSLDGQNKKYFYIYKARMVLAAIDAQLARIVIDNHAKNQGSTSGPSNRLTPGSASGSSSTQITKGASSSSMYGRCKNQAKRNNFESWIKFFGIPESKSGEVFDAMCNAKIISTSGSTDYDTIYNILAKAKDGGRNVNASTLSKMRKIEKNHIDAMLVNAVPIYTEINKDIGKQ